MASSSNGGSELSKTLKEGERILPASRRPDVTLRKPIRIRPGYTPPDEVPVYQSRGALWKKEMSSQDGPPGYDPQLDAKPKTTKAAKRNERKKEKRVQASLEKDKISEPANENNGSESVESLASELNELAVSSCPAKVSHPSDSTEGSNTEELSLDVDKKIRALKKKVRLAEAQIQKTAQKDTNPEQSEKLVKLEGWRRELKLLEDKKAEAART